MRFYLKYSILIIFISISGILYFPWIDNPLIFDDIAILKSPALYDFAQQPISLTPRQFPYFTLGFENILANGSFRLSRIVNIVLHATNGFLFFLLAEKIFISHLTARRAFFYAFITSALFVVHPVAVYAVAYLIQRTILFATFFLLLSGLQLNRAVSDRSIPRALFAGLIFGFSIMAKEHTLFGFIGILAIIWFRGTNDDGGDSLKSIILSFLSIVLPFVLWISSLKLGLIGSAYEPDAQAFISSADFPNHGNAFANWVFSASMQCMFFFRYFGYWLWPNASLLSIDIRPDFNFWSNYPWFILGPILIVGVVVFIVYTVRAQRVNTQLSLVSLGLFWALILFSIELSTVRFQEPIVLYRSYLWGPGFLLVLTGIASIINRRVVIIGSFVAFTIFMSLAWQRLSTFSSELTLWQEAAHKLPRPNTPGAIRIRYNIGVFQLREGHSSQALENFEWVIQQDPNSFAGYWGRAAVKAAKGDLVFAANDLESVIKIKPDLGIAHYQYGLILRKIGRLSESNSALAQAKRLGVTTTVLD